MQWNLFFSHLTWFMIIATGYYLPTVSDNGFYNKGVFIATAIKHGEVPFLIQVWPIAMSITSKRKNGLIHFQNHWIQFDDECV